MTEEITSLTHIPSGWTLVEFQEIADSVSLTGKKLKQSEYGETGKLPVIDQGQLPIGGYTDRVELQVCCTLPVIIFGDHTKIVKFIDFPFIAGADGIKVLEPSEVYYPKFLYYAIQSVALPDKGYARHFQFLEKSFVPLPPLPEQHRIVAKIEELFTRLDAGVEALKKIQLQLKRYRQSVLKAAFSGELTAEWRKAHKDELEPASILLEKIKQERKKSGKYKELPPLDTSDLPALPDGWEWARLGDISWFKNGINFTSRQKGNKGILTIDVLNMYSLNIRIKLDNVYRVDTTIGNEHILRNGDILFVRSSVKRQGVGWASLFSTDIKQPVTYCGFIIRARLYCDLLYPEYLTYVFRTASWRKWIIESSSQVTITNINQNALSKIIVPLPCFTEQQKIVEEIERCLSIADEIENTIEKSLKKSDRLRQSILKRAFEGKLVPQNPDDEPAEKLLERIKAERVNNKMYSKQGGLL